MPSRLATALPLTLPLPLHAFPANDTFEIVDVADHNDGRSDADSAANAGGGRRGQLDQKREQATVHGVHVASAGKESLATGNLGRN